MKIRFTVLTPTFNRADLLTRLFKSLQRQTFRNFEWVVINDGSTDNTEDVIKNFQVSDPGFEIKYLYQENGGKHRALNAGMKLAEGNMIFVADSDDWLPESALADCDEVERSIPSEVKHQYAGIGGLDGYKTGQLVGKTYNSDDYLDITFFERENYGIYGDKKEIYYADVLRQYPFPEIDGEKFLTEAIVYHRIAASGLKIRYFQRIIYLVEYQSNGLSALQGDYFNGSPLGWALYINEEMQLKKLSFKQRWNFRYGYYGSLRSLLTKKQIANNLNVNSPWFLFMTQLIRFKKKVQSILKSSNKASLQSPFVINYPLSITVFTSTYNRAYCLERLYNSLRDQTFTDFEWLVVDDGSTDNTEALVKSFVDNGDAFEIRYVRTENGGKHRAINKGVRSAKGRLFFIVDSDDFLPSDSLKRIDEIEKSIPLYKKVYFAGVCGLKSLSSGKIVGTTFDGEYIDISSIEQRKKGLYGDKAEIFYTNILSNYPFPEFEDEKFCTESIVWDRISKAGYKLRFFNQSIYCCEYLEDGLTNQGYSLYARNPKQWGLSIYQDYKFGKISFYGKGLEIYKYFLFEKNRITVKDMAKNLQTSKIALCLCVCAHYLLDIMRSLFGKKSIKATITDNTNQIV